MFGEDEEGSLEEAFYKKNEQEVVGETSCSAIELEAAEVATPKKNDCRPFIFDRSTGTWCMLDSGSQVSLWPETNAGRPPDPDI